MNDNNETHEPAERTPSEQLFWISTELDSLATVARLARTNFETDGEVASTLDLFEREAERISRAICAVPVSNGSDAQPKASGNGGEGVSIETPAELGDDPEETDLDDVDWREAEKVREATGNISAGTPFDDLGLRLDRVDALLMALNDIEMSGESRDTLSLIASARSELAAADRICEANGNDWSN